MPDAPTPAPKADSTVNVVRPLTPEQLATPTDPDRGVVVTPNATHVVTANGVGAWARGDKIGPGDLETGQDGIDRLVSLDAVRPMTADEKSQLPKPADKSADKTPAKK